jgi:hypothetical protein
LRRIAGVIFVERHNNLYRSLLSESPWRRQYYLRALAEVKPSR